MSTLVSRAVPQLSVVIPVYGCAAALPELHQRLTAAVAGFTADYELIFVNDHSPDASWVGVQQLAAHDPHVMGLNLSRNFGQHAALTAGLDRATGEWVVVMDCDLQDRPEEIPRLYAYAREQHLDAVFARRVARQDKASKQLGGRLFHGLLRWLGGPAQDPASGNFGIFHRRVVAALGQLREPTRAFPLQVHWLGFRRGALDVEHAARAQGRSSYRVGQLLRMAFPVVLAYSDKPLRLLVKLGVALAMVALLGAAYLAARALWGQAVSGVAVVLSSMWLLGGLLLAALGLVGLYVARTFDGVKNRPLYVVRDEVGPAGASG